MKMVEIQESEGRAVCRLGEQRSEEVNAQGLGGQPSDFELRP